MTNVANCREAEKLYEVAHQLVTYMVFRAAREGIPCQLSFTWCYAMLREGVRAFFGVVVSEDGLVQDLRQPELLAEWMKKITN